MYEKGSFKKIKIIKKNFTSYASFMLHIGSIIILGNLKYRKTYNTIK